MPTLFLDFDGVLHPGAPPVGWPIESRRDVEGREIGLLHFAESLADALGKMEVRIVLSTSWVETYGFEICRAFLPTPLADRVVDATCNLHDDAQHAYWNVCSRWQQINDYTIRNGLDHWLAVDDDAFDWPETERHRLVQTTPYLGLTVDDLHEIVRRLSLLAKGKSLLPREKRRRRG